MTDSRIRLVVFDWAGTTVDHGSFAPVAAMQEAFTDYGLNVPVDLIRAPMGLKKWDHIRTVLAMDSVREQWQAHHGRDWTDADVDAIHEKFLPLQLQTAIECSDLIAGAAAAVDELRRRDIRIGATTGYPRSIGEPVAEKARAQGYAPDAALYADDVPQARPAPWLIFRIMEQTGVYPPSAVVKVGDTIVDMEAGRNAGCWCVGVSATGSLLGLTEQELAALPEAERSQKIAAAGEQLLQAGAHAVIPSVEELPALIPTLEHHLQSGVKP